MKTFLLLMFLGAGSVLFGADTVSPAEAPTANVPEEITQFYHDVNFAACFSTPQERMLVHHMIKTNATGKLPERLQTVAKLIRRIRETTTRIDPQMAPALDGFDSSAKELIEISSLQEDGKMIRVEVCLRSVSPETNSWLVAQYEKAAPTDPAPIIAEVLRQTARKEIHTWIQKDGRWVRKEASAVLLKFGR